MERVKPHIMIMFFSLVCFACIEEVDLTNETTFESVLVVEAALTNELKKHQVILSLTNPISNVELVPTPETNAQVTIEEDGQIILFEEIEVGIYQSIVPFQAIQDKDYQLKIVRSNGRSYQSSVKQLTTATVMDDLYVERGLNEDDQEGVSVFIDAFDSSGSSKYYRFEYLEAYKIEAPLWINEDLVFDEEAEGGPCIAESYIKVPRSIEQQVCFNENRSNQIIITNTLELAEDRLDMYRVRFLNRNNYIISHRYTILVRQYILSQEAYFYYETLRNFSENESVLSETQIGFIEGNITSQINEGEKVVGFFDVNFVDEKRLYFNYEDLFPGENLPPYAKDCNFTYAPLLCLCVAGACSFPLIDALNDNNQWKYFIENENPSNIVEEGPYNLVVRACGDCTALGQTEPPEYWIE